MHSTNQRFSFPLRWAMTATSTFYQEHTETSDVQRMTPTNISALGKAEGLDTDWSHPTVGGHHVVCDTACSKNGLTVPTDAHIAAARLPTQCRGASGTTRHWTDIHKSTLGDDSNFLAFGVPALISVHLRYFRSESQQPADL